MAAFAPGAIGAAQAQDAETVTVSASRIVRDGFQAPTPTTVLGADDIAQQASANIYASVVQLPSLQGSQGEESNTGGTGGGNNGLSTFSMRGLGVTRTLTLVDGQRIVPSNVQGYTDVSQLPQLLIQRVDVVTGGASASWGSDAIAGVINFITNKKFEGFKANIQGGISRYGDDTNATFQAAAGTGFAGGRGHVLGSVEYSNSAGIGPGGYGEGKGAGGRKWFNSTTLLRYPLNGTPAGLPQYYARAHGQDVQFAPYGIITTGPLQGITFGTGGVPMQFNYGVGPTGLKGVPTGNSAGTVTNCVGIWCIGGDTSGLYANGVTLVSPLTRTTAYTRLSYDITPTTNIWVSASFGEVHTKNASVRNIPIFGGMVIKCGNTAGGPNAFLPASVNQKCIDNNITTFKMGTTNAQIPDGATVSTARTQRRFVAGGDGAFNLFGTDWTWDTYFQHGEVDSTIKVHTMMNPYFYAAVDSIQGPNGTVVCRDPVAQAQGCQPFNVFSSEAPSPSTQYWIFGGDHKNTSQLTHLKEDAFSLSTNGEPFSTWAGPVSVALGIEYRNEAYDVTGDPASTGGPGCNDPLLNCTGGGNWFNGNFYNGAGNYNVKEAFVETVLPLLKSSDWGEVNLNLAGRHARYSTAGDANTWKVGVTWETPVSGLRFRALQSRDIRAPNLSNLYAAQTVTTGTVVNDFTTQTVQVQNVSRGNTALTPEKALTTEVGVVYQPDWFPGFSTSVDYYRIGLKGQISSFNSQQIFDLCYQGFNTCGAIITAPPGGDLTKTSTVIAQMIRTEFNLASTITDGFDIEASYRFRLDDWGIPGDFTFRSLATRVSKFISTSGVPGTIPQESVGENGGSIPNWKIFQTQTYANDRWSITFQEKFISSGVLDRSYIQCTNGCPPPTATHATIDNNVLPGAFYFNIGGTYNLTDHVQTFFKIDNVTDVDPVQIPQAAPNNDNGVNPSLYDVVGRYFRVGVRVNM